MCRGKSGGVGSRGRWKDWLWVIVTVVGSSPRRKNNGTDDESNDADNGVVVGVSAMLTNNKATIAMDASVLIVHIVG